MEATITVRADSDLRAALERRAAAQGKTVSQVVREILHQALDERSMAARVGHLRGSLETSPGVDDDLWRREIRARNWRP